MLNSVDTCHQNELIEILSIDNYGTAAARPKCDVVIFGRLEYQMSALRDDSRPARSAHIRKLSIHQTTRDRMGAKTAYSDAQLVGSSKLQRRIQAAVIQFVSWLAEAFSFFFQQRLAMNCRVASGDFKRIFQQISKSQIKSRRNLRSKEVDIFCTTMRCDCDVKSRWINKLKLTEISIDLH